MNHRYLLKTLAIGALIAVPVGAALAQQAVTVSGHVTAAGAALVGAHVRVAELRPPIDRVTDASGYYSFIVPSSSVHGQLVAVTVSMTDRRIKYATATVSVRLVGLPVQQDFDLKITSGEPLPMPVESPVTNSSRPGGPTVTPTQNDSIDLSYAAGAVDLLSALSGRFAGLSITEPGVLGGSSLAGFRGARSALGLSQPLIVIDGIPVDNTVFASSAQRYGAGGFDYGSPVQDLDLSTIGTVRFVSGPEASVRFGGRAANGVLLVTTKTGAHGPGLAITGHEQVTSESHGRLPEFQNQFGQGLNGKYSFFDGRGGGVNDAVDQSWGPPLDNRPLAQASLTEAGAADVRLWTAHPSNVRDYFNSGRTVNSEAAVQGAADFGSFRASVGNRATRGLVPNNTLSRRTGGFSGTVTPFGSTTFGAWVFGGETKDDGAPGTGDNQGNPVSQFTRLGRQVDATTMRAHLLDASGKQISWMYVNQNNPYFAALENTNSSVRNHVTAGGSVSLALSPWLDARAQTGTDYYRDVRAFYIHNGWMGGFPFFAAPTGGSFSKGGSEGDAIASQQTNSSVRFDAHRVGAYDARWTLSFGGDVMGARDRIRSAGVDSAVNVPIAGAGDTAKIPSSVSWNAHARTNAAFGEAGVLFNNSATARFGVRNEWSSIAPGQHATTLYPSLSAGVDLVRALSSLHTQTRFNALNVHASWSSSAGELAPFVLQTLYSGRAPSGAITPNSAGSLAVDTSLTPEVTNAWQVGVDATVWSRRADIGLTFYRERTSDVILPVPDTTLKTLTARNAGVISNTGVQLQATLRFDREGWLGWEISGNAAKNSNSVDKLFGSASAIDIAPPQVGIHIQAKTGEPLGALVGLRLLRDPSSHALILRNGLPLPDSVTGAVQLGDAEPNWIVGLRNSFRIGRLTIDAMADGHFGGSIFSTTNLWGSYAGTLQSTAFRPDSGLLIAGVDASGGANTKHATTQDYFHALAAVQEPWVYSASYFKVREVRARISLPTSVVRGLPFSGISAAIVARNLYLWAKAPNIDPETLLSPYQFGGVEMGQLPSTRSVGFQVTLTP